MLCRFLFYCLFFFFACKTTVCVISLSMNTNDVRLSFCVKLPSFSSVNNVFCNICLLSVVLFSCLLLAQKKNQSVRGPTGHDKGHLTVNGPPWQQSSKKRLWQTKVKKKYYCCSNLRWCSMTTILMVSSLIIKHNYKIERTKTE